MADVEQYRQDVATTLNLIERTLGTTVGGVLVRDNVVLQLRIPADKMPQSGEELNEFRDQFIDVVSSWSQRQQIIVVLHGLIEREVSNDQQPKDETEIVKAAGSEFLFAAPRDNKGADLIYAGEKFMQELGNLRIPAGLGNDPTMVTLISGSNWERVGGKAYEKGSSETDEERAARNSPLFDFVFSPAANRLLHARVVADLLH